MYDDLSQLTDNNVSVEIITNDVAKGANPWGCTDYLNEKEKIWRTGVKVYEYMAPHSCHTKAVLIDDRMSIAFFPTFPYSFASITNLPFRIITNKAYVCPERFMTGENTYFPHIYQAVLAVIPFVFPKNPLR